jgi:hypothetical protein
MITIEHLLSIKKEDLGAFAPQLDGEDIRQLVDWLAEKDDQIRYASFLLLQHRSQTHPDVYPFWETFKQKLSSPNSYQRSLGLMLIAENVRWDHTGQFGDIVDLYLTFVDDEKPITVRQCIQSLSKIVPYKPHLLNRITDKLTAVDILARKETQRKILLVDILTILIQIKNEAPSPGIDAYIHQMLTGGILDKKSRTALEKLIR